MVEGKRFSADEKRDFMRNGFVVINDAISDTLLSRLRASFWKSMPVDRDNPNTWINDGELDDRPVPADIEAHEQLLRELYPYAEDLVGEKLAPPDVQPNEDCPHANHMEFDYFPEHNGLMAPFPNYPGTQFDGVNIPEDVFDLPQYMPHLDSGGSGYYDGFTLVVGAYVSPAPPRGGGYTAWPGSHKIVRNYFEDSPTLERLYTIAQQTDNDETLVDQFDLGQPFEITGPAGTAFLAHPALIHTKGPNMSGRIRKLCYCKLSREDIEFNDLEPLTDIWAPFDGLSP